MPFSVTLHFRELLITLELSSFFLFFIQQSLRFVGQYYQKNDARLMSSLTLRRNTEAIKKTMQLVENHQELAD